MEKEEKIDIDERCVEEEINSFGAMLGEETKGKYKAYVYRLKKEEGRWKKEFLERLDGQRPDPQDIAEKFRCGKYHIQYVWYKAGKQNNKSWTLDISEETFPPIPKSPQNSLIPYNPSMSDSVQLQLATISAITDVMKAAYTGSGGNQMPRVDPMEQFGNIFETMEAGFMKAMSFQSQIHERILRRAVESKYGLLPEENPQIAASPEEESVVSKYVPIIREIVDGLKSVFALFGSSEVPKSVVSRVKENERFKDLLKDPKAIVVIGQALRREFGDDKAAAIMRSFGVEMVRRGSQTVSKTPDIPGTHAPEAAGTASGQQGSKQQGVSGSAAKGQGSAFRESKKRE